MTTNPLTVRRRRPTGACVCFCAALAAAVIGARGAGRVEAAEERMPSQIGRVEVRCPVCAAKFRALAVVVENTYEGVDGDLFARAIGPQPEFYRVSTCPSCLYSGYLTDFDEGVVLPPDFVRGVLEDRPLEPATPIDPDADQREIPALTRYGLALDCYDRMQRSEEARGWLCLRASWVAREETAILAPEPRVQRMMQYVSRWLPEVRGEENQAERELALATQLAAAIAEGRFSVYQEPFAECVLAFLLRRHGENEAALSLLDRLLWEGKLPGEVQFSVQRMHESVAVERRWQRRAVRHFERAVLLLGVSSENAGAARYLLGELYRRLGERREAAEHYAAALAVDELPADLRRWARQQQRVASENR